SCSLSRGSLFAWFETGGDTISSCVNLRDICREINEHRMRFRLACGSQLHTNQRPISLSVANCHLGRKEHGKQSRSCDSAESASTGSVHLGTAHTEAGKRSTRRQNSNG